jgi:alkaline phosphatase
MKQRNVKLSFLILKLCRFESQLPFKRVPKLIFSVIRSMIIFCQGPLASHLFSGSVDQSYIPHAVAYAACLGEHNQRCSGGPDNYSVSDPGPAACSAPAPEPNAGVVRGGVVVASSVMADDSVTPHGAAMSGTRTFAIFAMVLLLTSVVLYGFEFT